MSQNKTDYEEFVNALTKNGQRSQLRSELTAFYQAPVILDIKPIHEIKDLLDNSFIVGEAHLDISPKQFLINNMQLLKKNGFSILFMEHLFYEDQNVLDEMFEKYRSESAAEPSVAATTSASIAPNMSAHSQDQSHHLIAKTPGIAPARSPAADHTSVAQTSSSFSQRVSSHQPSNLSPSKPPRHPSLNPSRPPKHPSLSLSKPPKQLNLSLSIAMSSSQPMSLSLPLPLSSSPSAGLSLPMPIGSYQPAGLSFPLPLSPSPSVGLSLPTAMSPSQPTSLSLPMAMSPFQPSDLMLPQPWSLKLAPLLTESDPTDSPPLSPVLARTPMPGESVKSHTTMQQQLKYFDDNYISRQGKNIAIARKNTFTNVVEAALKAGIRVVAIDTEFTYEEQKIQHSSKNYRMESMNYTAVKIIKKETEQTPGKWCALMGNAHLKTFDAVPGVSELLAVPSIGIYDEPTLKPRIGFNENKIADSIEGLGDAILKPFEVILESNPARNVLSPLLLDRLSSPDNDHKPASNRHNFFQQKEEIASVNVSAASPSDTTNTVSAEAGKEEPKSP